MTNTAVETPIDCLLSSIDQSLRAVARDPQAESAPDDRRADPKIMIIDDEILNILVVAGYLEEAGYQRLVRADDAFQASALARREQPDAILLDLHMPRRDGFEVLKEIRSDETLKQTPVIILTASTDDREKLRALELGATDFLHKPFHSGELVARLRNILMAKAYQDHWRNYSKMLEDAVRARTAELEQSRREVIDCLARAAEFRDDDTGRHVIRVGRYARIIGEELGFDVGSLEMLEQAAKLHDIGKIGVPDSILLKPGRLTSEELDAMRQHSRFGKQIIAGSEETDSPELRGHVELGAKILSSGRSPILALATRIAMSHHERWDGTGYPLGLAGPMIPEEGRITAVADVFDALSRKRPYKPAFPLEECFAIMRDGRGTHFDPRVLDAFFARQNSIAEIARTYAD